MTRVSHGIASSAFHSVPPLQVSAEDVTDKKVQQGLTTDGRRRLVDRSTRSGKCNETAGLNQQFFQKLGFRFAKDFK